MTTTDVVLSQNWGYSIAAAIIGTEGTQEGEAGHGAGLGWREAELCPLGEAGSLWSLLSRVEAHQRVNWQQNEGQGHREAETQPPAIMAD